jgi:glutathione S-transferase
MLSGRPVRPAYDAAASAKVKAATSLQLLRQPVVSAADPLVAPILAYVRAMPEGGALMAQYPNVVRAHANICARPSFNATQP